MVNGPAPLNAQFLHALAVIHRGKGPASVNVGRIESPHEGESGGNPFSDMILALIQQARRGASPGVSRSELANRERADEAPYDMSQGIMVRRGRPSIGIPGGFLS